MYAPNYRSAQALQTRIEPSILDGTWKQLKKELAGGNRTSWTVRSFYERFLRSTVILTRAPGVAMRSRSGVSTLRTVLEQSEVLSAQWCTGAEGQLKTWGHLWGQPNTYNEH